MKKRNRIIYWIATIWLCLGMLSTGFVQLLQLEDEIAFIVKLGYPRYFITMLGLAKIVGVVAILIPKNAVLKEWAYAGFVFTMAGAIFSHISVGSPVNEILPALLLLLLSITSWIFRSWRYKNTFTQLAV